MNFEPDNPGEDVAGEDVDCEVGFARACEPSTQSPRPALALRSRLGPLAGSVLLHAIVIFVLVKTMIGRSAAPFAIQVGSGTGEISTVAGDGLPPPRSDPQAALPSGGLADSPRPIDLPSMPVPSDAPSTTHKSPAELLEPPAESSVLGIGVDSAVDFSTQFPHPHPARWQMSAGAAAAASDLPFGAAPGGSSARAALAGDRQRGVGIAPGTGGGTTGMVGGGLSNNKPVPYPADARRRQWQGTVWLLVDLREDGSVDRISIDESCGHDLLDQSALHAVRKWRFPRFEVDGQPVRKQVLQKIEFILPG